MNVLEIKAAVRERDGNRCAECGMLNEQHVERYGSILEVHRVIPGSEYSLEAGACVTLCIPCHGPKPKRPHGSSPWRYLAMDGDLYHDLSIIAAALGLTVPEYVEDVVAAARDRDMSKAAKIAQDKATHASKKHKPSP